MRNDIATTPAAAEPDPGIPASPSARSAPSPGLVILAADDASEATCSDDLCLPAGARPAEPTEGRA